MNPILAVVAVASVVQCIKSQRDLWKARDEIALLRAHIMGGH